MNYAGKKITCKKKKFFVKSKNKQIMKINKSMGENETKINQL